MSAALRTTAEARLATLRQDLAHGHAQLAHLQDVLPKIEGAVQVLEEILAIPEPAAPADGDAREETPCPNPNGAVPSPAL